MLKEKEVQKQTGGGEQDVRLSSNLNQALSLDTMLSATKFSCKSMGPVLPMPWSETCITASLYWLSCWSVG